MARRNNGPAEIPEWERMQIRTFTAWMNSYLQRADAAVEDLTTDLADGLLLIKLLEVVTGNKVPDSKYKKKPRSKIQQISNLTYMINYMQNEGLRTTCSPENINDGNLTMILGFVWMLILHFQITNFQAEDLLDGSLRSMEVAQAHADGETSKRRNVSMTKAKKELLDWCRGVLSDHTDLEIKSFKSSFGDGRVLCALCAALEPTCLDFESQVDAEAPVDNLNLAFEVAESHFDVPRLLDADQMVAAPDEQSVMTYVSYFRAWWFVRQRAMEDLRRRENELRMATDAVQKVAEDEQAVLRAGMDDLLKKLAEAERGRDAALGEVEKLRMRLEAVSSDLSAEVAQRETLETKNETLLDALRTAEAAREALEAEMMGYKSTVEEEASAGAALSENVARLEADLAACREECGSLHVQLEAAERVAEGSTTKVETLTARVEALRTERDEALAEGSDAHARIDDLAAAKTELQSEVESLEAANERLQATNADLGAQVSSSAASLETALREVKTRDERILDLESEVTNVKLAREKLSRTLENVSTEKAEVEARLTASEASLVTVTEQLADKTAREEAVRSQLREANARLTDKETELVGVKDERNTLDGKVTKLKSTLERVSAELHAQITELDTTNAALVDKITSLKAKNSAAKDKSKTLKAALLDSQAALDQATALQEQLAAKIQREKEKRAELLSSNEQTTETLEEQLAQLAGERAQLDSLVEDLQKQVADLTAENAKLARQVDSKKTKLENLVAAYEELESELNSTRTRGEALEVEVARLLAVETKMADKLKKSKDRVAILKAGLTDKTHELEDLEQQSERLVEKIQRERTKRALLKDELVNMGKDLAAAVQKGDLAKQQLVTYHDLVSELELKLHNATDRVGQLDAEVVALADGKHEVEQRLAAAEADLVTTRDSLAKAEERAAAKEAELAKAKQDLQASKRMSMSADLLVKTRDEDMETLRGELEWAHQKLAAAEQETRDARAQVAAADDELTALQAAKAAVEARHKTLRDQVALLEVKLEVAEAERSAAEEELAELRNAAASTEDTMNNEKETLLRKAKKYAKEQKKAQSVLVSQMQDNARLEDELEEAHAALITANRRVDELEASLEEFTATVGSLRAQLQTQASRGVGELSESRGTQTTQPKVRIQRRHQATFVEPAEDEDGNREVRKEFAVAASAGHARVREKVETKVISEMGRQRQLLHEKIEAKRLAKLQRESEKAAAAARVEAEAAKAKEEELAVAAKAVEDRKKKKEMVEMTVATMRDLEVEIHRTVESELARQRRITREKIERKRKEKRERLAGLASEVSRSVQLSGGRASVGVQAGDDDDAWRRPHGLGVLKTTGLDNSGNSSSSSRSPSGRRPPRRGSARVRRASLSQGLLPSLPEFGEGLRHDATDVEKKEFFASTVKRADSQREAAELKVENELERQRRQLRERMMLKRMQHSKRGGVVNRRIARRKSSIAVTPRTSIAGADEVPTITVLHGPTARERRRSVNYEIANVQVMEVALEAQVESELEKQRRRIQEKKEAKTRRRLAKLRGAVLTTKFDEQPDEGFPEMRFETINEFATALTETETRALGLENDLALEKIKYDQLREVLNNKDAEIARLRGMLG